MGKSLWRNVCVCVCHLQTPVYRHVNWREIMPSKKHSHRPYTWLFNIITTFTRHMSMSSHVKLREVDPRPESRSVCWPWPQTKVAVDVWCVHGQIPALNRFQPVSTDFNRIQTHATVSTLKIYQGTNLADAHES